MLRNILFVFSLLFALVGMAQPFTVAGVIEASNGEAIGSMTIALLAADGSVLSTQSVDCDGQYTFSGLESGVDYSLRLDKENSSAFNGVSTFDLVLISRHLLDVQPFSNPYSVVAADVDESGVISITDIMIAQSIVYAQVTSFPGQNWFFFNEGNSLPATEFPITLTADLLDFNFIGVKKADVNNSANTCE
ncbi:hypothetical protein [Lewinella sp. LCG006]|uniref:hypothetical protein n=1 Tax=Lewinella sp. LCG006 TaxID=3231911 RepID=UPI003460C0A0